MEMGILFRSLPAVFTLGLLFWGLAIPGPVDPETAAAGSPILGGPCEYKGYRGQARIVSVQPVLSAGENGTTFEVAFSFHSAVPISESFARTEGRTFLLTMRNGTYPGQKFLEKYRIETDRVFDCTLQVITKGTCTPTQFEFAGIDLNDYGTR